MYTFEVTFRFPGEFDDTALDHCKWLLNAWYQHGQINQGSWHLAWDDRTVRAFVDAPASDSLDEARDNAYAVAGRTRLRDDHGATVEVALLDGDLDPDDDCTCADRSSYLLYTKYTTHESPLRCGDCFLPLPLYTAPPLHDDGYYFLLKWADDYRACDTLQMHAAVGERFAERQLLDANSALSTIGRRLCGQLEAGLDRPVYYFLMKMRGRSWSSEQTRRCPLCGGPWLLKERWHDLLDYRCETCRLVANIAYDVADRHRCRQNR